MNKNIDIIVSRYNEDLSWMNEEPFNRFNYIIYNKGINENFEKKYALKTINLPNVGKCDHTYLYHIVNNFNNLSNVNVFFPGSLNNEYKKNNAKKILYEILNRRKAVFLGTYTNDLRINFKNFTLDSYLSGDLSNRNLNPEEILLPAIIRPFGKWFLFHFGNIKVNYWCIHGIFSVSKKDITKHNIIRYQQLLDAVGRHSNPEVGHYIERSWAALFHPLLFTQVI